MNRLRALRAAASLVLPLFLLGLPIRAAFPQAVDATQQTRVCQVNGTIDVSPGVGRMPIGSNNDGTYTFLQVSMLCAGSAASASNSPSVTATGAPEMTGLGSMSSSGSFGVNNCGGTDVSLTGSICGTFAMTGFLLSAHCYGTLGGDEWANTNPANVLASDWSITVDNLMMGGVTCDQVVPPAGANFLATSPGVFALGVSPNPLTMDGQLNGLDPYLGECPAPPPLAGDPNIAATWYCQIIVSGIMVFTSESASTSDSSTSLPTLPSTSEPLPTVPSIPTLPTTTPPPPPPTGEPSTHCGAGVGIDNTNPVVVRTRVLTVDARTTWVCVRAGTLGGKVVIVTPGNPPGAPSQPTTDTSADMCHTTTPNAVPGPHPLVSGTIDPGNPDIPYLLDVYNGSGQVWVCARAGTSAERVIVPIPGVPNLDLGSITFQADTGTPDPI